jgi:hypothetical protein
MRVKVHGGTVAHGEPSLCYTCRHATIVKGTPGRLCLRHAVDVARDLRGHPDPPLRHPSVGGRGTGAW